MFCNPGNSVTQIRHPPADPLVARQAPAKVFKVTEGTPASKSVKSTASKRGNAYPESRARIT
jgi:hypothetical protein